MLHIPPGQLFSGSVFTLLGEHTPSAPVLSAALHEKQMALQAVSQQWPSTQLPVWQVPPVTHAAPLAFPHAPLTASHGRPFAQSAMVVQDERH
jgi:hypothetical protein